MGELSCELLIRRFNHEGALLGEAACEGTLQAAQVSELLKELPSELVIEEPTREFLHATLRCGDSQSERVFHLGHRRDWVLFPAAISATATTLDDGLIEVTLEAATYVHFVSLSVDDPLARYSDNFFDLLPGEPRMIEIRTAGNVDVTVTAANADRLQIAVT